ncbi:retrovirus-related pol polyprotein from transposon TNT 1-94 [Tanacetum coccineum]
MMCYLNIFSSTRAKKAAKTHDPLALVAHTSSSSSRSPPHYYVTLPSTVVDYDDNYQGDTFSDDEEDSHTSAMMLLVSAIMQRYSTPTNNQLHTSSNIRNQAVVQVDKVNIQSKNVGNGGSIARRSYNTQEENCYNYNARGHYARDCPKPRVRDSKYFMEQMLLAKKDEAGVILSNEQNDFLFTDAAQMEGVEELSANICMMDRIQQTHIDFDEEPSYDSAFIGEVQKPSTSFMNPLFSKSDHEQKYYEQPKIINSTNGDDQINSDIIFDDPNVKVNNGNVEHDKNAPGQHDNDLELLDKNAYKEAEKQLVLAKKVKQQNVELTK